MDSVAPEMKRSRWREVAVLVKEAVTAWRRDRASRLAAALAYYTLLSLAPLLIILVVVAGQVYGAEAARGEVALRLRLLVGYDRLGSDTAEFVQSLIENAGQQQTGGIIATIISVVALLWSASQVFNQLQGALDAIWQVRPAEGRGLLHVVQDRFTAFVMVLFLGTLLLLIFALSAWLTAANAFLRRYTVPTFDLLPLFNLVLPFVVIAVAFSIIYKVLPNVHISWKTALIGGVVTAILFSIGNVLIGLYLSYRSIGSTYGAAGSFLVILVWVYYSAQVILLGAEFTKVYAFRYGESLRPERDAVFVEVVSADEPDLETVAATLPVPEVQVVAQSLQEPESTSVPPARVPDEPVAVTGYATTGTPSFSYRWLLVAAATFIAGLLLGRRD